MNKNEEKGYGKKDCPKYPGMPCTCPDKSTLDDRKDVDWIGGTQNLSATVLFGDGRRASVDTPGFLPHRYYPQ